MVGCNLAGHWQAFFLGGPDQENFLPGGDVAKVNRPSCLQAVMTMWLMYSLLLKSLLPPLLRHRPGTRAERSLRH